MHYNVQPKMPHRGSVGRTHRFASQRSVIHPLALGLAAAHSPEELWQLPQQVDEQQASCSNDSIPHPCMQGIMRPKIGTRFAEEEAEVIRIVAAELPAG